MIGLHSLEEVGGMIGQSASHVEALVCTLEVVGELQVVVEADK
jgi:hypothetical protein